ncbi:MAG: ATP-binding domain-containing protein, partial [Bacteroidota bacterium]|nr:ATP-binding domain-containing protein [Bacteroidota bacterium]
IASLVVDIVVRRIPREMGYDPVTAIQVLSPMYTTQAGVDHLNLRLRRELNPHGSLILHKGEDSWHIGDKVMQTKNDYGKDVFNGDIGRIVGADDEEALVTVRFDERDVVFAYDELSSLTHAYAITIHKSQGSEYDVVVLPVTMQHRIMLQRNLLYTAMTRARKLLVCVGQRSALEYGVRNERPAFRHTRLAEALRDAFR